MSTSSSTNPLARDVLKAAINMSNMLLVSGETDGVPYGVSPDVAVALARYSGLEAWLIPYRGPADVVRGVETWDVANIASDPERAEQIWFSEPYAGIEASLLVRDDESAGSIVDVDDRGVRVGVRRGAAYALWLERNLDNASLISYDRHDDVAQAFKQGEVDMVASLRSRLFLDAERIPGTRVVDGNFMSVAQAIGIPRTKPEAARSLVASFVAHIRETGLVGDLIHRHGVSGLVAL